MNTLPALDLRKNLGTWAVPECVVPRTIHALTSALPVEAFDPAFQGQDLTTTYFDTKDFDLRKARNRGDRYLTLRIRCYEPKSAYALSAKTEDGKFRMPLEPDTAELLCLGLLDFNQPDLLPGDLQSRLADLTQQQPLLAVTTIRFRRFAVENEEDRFTFDTDIRTDAGKRLWTNVLEFKSTQLDAQPYYALDLWQLTPIKLSKFLWATRM
jgi:hypothetical protein